MQAVQADDDNDGIGDACDTCEVASEYGTCQSDSDCDFGFCILEPTGDPDGRCSQESDDDGDGISDACDVCPSFQNVSDVNSNALAERREQELNSFVRTLGDECDPVPILRLQEQVAERTSLVPTPGDNQGPDDLAAMVADTWLGRDNQTGPTDSFDQDVTYRHCSCIRSDGTRLGLDECIAANMQCDWTQPETSQFWDGISTTNDAIQDARPPFATVPATFTTQQPAQLNRFWRWRDDLIGGQVEGSGTCTSDPLSCETYGALATITINTNGFFFSSRDGQADLRDVFRLYQTPAYAVAPLATPFRIPVASCLPTGCNLRWFRDELINPVLFPGGSAGVPDLTDPLVAGVLSSGLIAERDGALLLLEASGDATAIDAGVSTRVAQALTDQQSQWLPPVEPTSQLAAVAQGRQLQPQAAVLDDSFDGTAPTVVWSTPDGLRTTDELFGDAVDVARAAAAAPDLVPRAQSKHLGVFSGIERAVYMVGGQQSEDEPSGTVWRYSIPDRAWELVGGTDGIRPDDVLSVAYAQQSSQLFVLDLAEREQPGLRDSDLSSGRRRSLRRRGRLRLPRFARLFVIDTRTGESKALAEWPYFGLHRRLDLVADADGRLILIAARRYGYSTWRFDVGDRLQLTGVRFQFGKVLDRPVMGDAHPLLAVDHRGKTEIREIRFGLGHHYGAWPSAL